MGSRNPRSSRIAAPLLCSGNRRLRGEAKGGQRKGKLAAGSPATKRTRSRERRCGAIESLRSSAGPGLGSSRSIRSRPGNDCRAELFTTEPPGRGR